MPEYDDTNSGMMSRNDNKTSDNQPDFKGFVNVEGTEYWLSAWVKVAGEMAKQPGRKFFSIALTPKEATRSADGTGAAAEPPLDDDIPF